RLSPPTSRGRPYQLGGEVMAVDEGARRLDHGQSARRLVGARRIGGQHVAPDRDRPRAPPAAERAVLTDAALSAELALAQLAKQRRRSPDLGEALRPKVARHFREIRARRQLPVRRDAAVLGPAGTAGLV